MKARPILFSAPMVRALLEGRKTQTRRIIKPQPVIGEHGNYRWDGKHGGFVGCMGTHAEDFAKYAPDYCFYGQSGDLLWVRETWRKEQIVIDGVIQDRARYPEDGHLRREFDPCKYKPSIHMPRWASRITLEITQVRAQRLQEISEEDKAAEGATAEVPFGTVWKRINTKPGIRWEDNPWVWAVTFNVHQQNVDQLLKARAA